MLPPLLIDRDESREGVTGFPAKTESVERDRELEE
jgi:hypothetical protein